MDDMIIGMGFAGSPVRGEKKDSGEYVLPAEVVEYHGIKHIRSLEDEAYWSMQESEEVDTEVEEEILDELEELEEDDPDTLEVEKPKKSEQKNNFGIKKKAKTAFMK